MRKALLRAAVRLFAAMSVSFIFLAAQPNGVLAYSADPASGNSDSSMSGTGQPGPQPLAKIPGSANGPLFGNTGGGTRGGTGTKSGTNTGTGGIGTGTVAGTQTGTGTGNGTVTNGTQGTTPDGTAGTTPDATAGTTAGGTGTGPTATTTFTAETGTATVGTATTPTADTVTEDEEDVGDVQGVEGGDAVLGVQQAPTPAGAQLGAQQAPAAAAGVQSLPSTSTMSTPLGALAGLAAALFALRRPRR